MARLEERDYVYFNTVRSYCGTCRESVPARVFFRAGQVWQQGLCPRCASEPVLIASDQQWYLRETQKTFPSCAPVAGASAPQRGCPNDCGPCSWHASRCHSVEINACCAGEALTNLGTVERLYVNCQGTDAGAVLQKCGVSPQVREVVLRSPGMNNLDSLASCGAAVVLPPRHEYDIARLTAAGVRVELEASPEDAGAVLKLLRSNENVIALTIIATSVPVDAAVRMVCEQSGGDLSPGDFRPDSAHPLCWLEASFGQPPRRVAVHAIMAPEAFDCFRAMLCPHWTLVRRGVAAPACAAGLIYAGEPT